MIVLAECPCSESICAEGEETGGNLSVVLPVLMINSVPSSFFPLLQLAWQKTPKLAVTSNMVNNNKMWEERNELSERELATRLRSPLFGDSYNISSVEKLFWGKRGQDIFMSSSSTKHSKQPNWEGTR